MTFEKFNNKDILSLSVFAILTCGRICLNLMPLTGHELGVDKIIYEIVVDFLVLFVVTTTPFCIRFRNGYFAIAWVFISIVFISTDVRPITTTPLFLYITFCVIRFTFRKIYNREFIPSTLSKSKSYAYFSKLDNMQSGKEDSVFMRLYFFIGLLSLIGSIFLSGHR